MTTRKRSVPSVDAWDDDESLLDVFTRLHPSAPEYAFWWWSMGVIDERRQRGDYTHKRRSRK